VSIPFPQDFCGISSGLLKKNEISQNVEKSQTRLKTAILGIFCKKNVENGESG
jgi:hypothetical protein